MSRQWTVTARCVVTKKITCEDCTEEQALADPFEYAVDELEVDQEDWSVIRIEEAQP